jgi:aspartate racemase
MTHKKIGIIGGLSPESTVSYYLHITRTYAARFGEDSYPEVIIYSVNLEQYHQWREADRWDLITEHLATVANKLLVSGADFGLIATNTMHKVFGAVQAKTDLPLLHILDPTIEAIHKAGITKIGLLGTRFTMAGTFYRDHLAAHGIDTITPDARDQQMIHEIIVTELVRGVISAESRARYQAVMDRLASAGAQGIILGCTEIPLLIQSEQFPLPLFDTATLHARAALDRAVAQGVPS